MLGCGSPWQMLPSHRVAMETGFMKTVTHTLLKSYSRYLDDQFCCAIFKFLVQYKNLFISSVSLLTNLSQLICHFCTLIQSFIFVNVYIVAPCHFRCQWWAYYSKTPLLKTKLNKRYQIRDYMHSAAQSHNDDKTKTGFFPMFLLYILSPLKNLKDKKTHCYRRRN